MSRSWHTRAGAARRSCSRESSFSFLPETPLPDPTLLPSVRRRIALAGVATASTASWEGALKVNFSDLGSPRLSRFRRVFRTSLLRSARAQARSSRDSLGLGSIGIAFSPSCLTFRTYSIVPRKQSVSNPQGSEPISSAVTLSLPKRLPHGFSAIWAARGFSVQFQPLVLPRT